MAKIPIAIPLYEGDISPLFARADFKPALFDNMINQKGYIALWEQSLMCSCIRQDTGQPDYNCPVCKGRSYSYLPSAQIKIIATSINGRKDQGKIGLDEQGSAYATPVSTVLFGYRDRITFLDFYVKYTQIISRNVGGLDTPRYNINTIISLKTLTSTYTLGTDFTVINSGENIQWISVCDSETYSILYTTHPVYICMGPIHELRGTRSMLLGLGADYFQPMPCQYQIKREDFVDRTIIGGSI